jgi:hypothetical protein
VLKYCGLLSELSRVELLYLRLLEQTMAVFSPLNSAFGRYLFLSPSSHLNSLRLHLSCVCSLAAAPRGYRGRKIIFAATSGFNMGFSSSTRCQISIGVSKDPSTQRTFSRLAEKEPSTPSFRSTTVVIPLMVVLRLCQ